MGGFGAPELLVVFVVVLLVFGPRRIPEVARGIGVAVREFRRLTVEFQRELNLAEALEEERTGKGPGRVPPRDAVPRAPDLDPNAPRPSLARSAAEASARRGAGPAADAPGDDAPASDPPPADPPGDDDGADGSPPAPPSG